MLNPKGEKGKELDIIHESVWHGLFVELASWSSTLLALCVSFFIGSLVFFLFVPMVKALIIMAISIILFVLLLYIRATY